MKKQGITKDVKELILARIDVMPGNLRLSMGSYGSFTRDELKEHVKREDEVGQKIVNIQMSYLTALKKGDIYKK